MSGPVDHVAFHAALHPGALAMVDLAQDLRLTYADLDTAVARCARVLALWGVGEGDRVAVLAHNRIELLVLHLACARCGAIYAPMNWRLAPAEVHALIADIDPTVVIGDFELARCGLAGADIASLWTAIQAAPRLATPPIDPVRPSLLLYTSGASGRPKGVLLSEANLEQSAINFGRLGRLTHDSVFLNDAPMFHVMGLVVAIRSTLLHGAAMLISDAFDPGRTLERMADTALRVSHYFCVPQMAARLWDHPDFHADKLKGLTALFTGGAPHPAASIRPWLASGIPVADGYGMTETGTVLGMSTDRAQIGARAGSAGIAMPGVRTRIVDGVGDDCPFGVPGELLVKGANVFSSYWRRPEETSAAFTADGWFRTGDIAVADEAGFHWLVDRKKDMFISGGENVYPAQIEAVLVGHPAVAECAVVGLPDAVWGEVGHAAVVLRRGETLSHGEMVAFLQAELARFKIPRALTVVATLPRTATGKVDKLALRRLLIDERVAG